MRRAERSKDSYSTLALISPARAVLMWELNEEVGQSEFVWSRGGEMHEAQPSAPAAHTDV